MNASDARRMERERRVLQLLGLARRAGHAVVGTQAVKDAADRGELTVVIVAGDATANAWRRLEGTVGDGRVPVVSCGTRESLGRAVGRGGAVVAGVRDRGLGERIESLGADVP